MAGEVKILTLSLKNKYTASYPPKRGHINFLNCIITL